MEDVKIYKSENRFGLKISKSSLFVYVLLIPSLVAYHALDRAKLIYFIPLIMLLLPMIFAISSKKGNEQTLKIEPNLIFAIVLYTVIAGLSILFNYDTLNYKILIRDILIIFSPLIVFSTEMRFNDRNIKFLFIAVIISYFTWVGFQFEFDWSFNFLRSNYNMASEFHNGVIIGGFFLFFLYRKKYVWMLLALILIFMSGKRSIILGIIPAIVGYYGFIKPLKIEENKYWLLVILFGYFIILFFIGVNFDTFSLWILDITNLEQEVELNRFLMGREIFIVYLKNQINQSEILQALFGYGPGQADQYLLEFARPDWMSNKGQPVNPHNDFLKLNFDYGLIGGIAMFFIFYSVYITGSPMGTQMFLYTLPLFLVDNSFIFIYYWFIALTLARYQKPSNEVES